MCAEAVRAPAKASSIIPAAEMAAKIRAAADARAQPDFVIIARTDARAVEGLERAVERARIYREAGARRTVHRGRRD